MHRPGSMRRGLLQFTDRKKLSMRYAAFAGPMWILFLFPVPAARDGGERRFPLNLVTNRVDTGGSVRRCTLHRRVDACVNAPRVKRRANVNYYRSMSRALRDLRSSRYRALRSYGRQDQTYTMNYLYASADYFKISQTLSTGPASLERVARKEVSNCRH